MTPLDRIVRGKWPTRALVSVGLLLPLALITVTIIQPFTDPRWLYFDPLTAAEMAPECCRVYFGFMSMLGIKMWTMTAAVCLFSALMLFLTNLSPALMRFATFAGLLTGWLALDDAFLIHENILPALGVPQNAVLVTYGLLGLGYLWMARRYLKSIEGVFFLGAGMGFVVSVAIDVIIHSVETNAIVAEDGAKFFGIWCWMIFNGAVLARGLIFEDMAIGLPGEKDDVAAFHADAESDVPDNDEATDANRKAA
ncbi:MAG: hypothetical protein AAF590_06290 [Pseudomonadota bacterium]